MINTFKKIFLGLAGLALLGNISCGNSENRMQAQKNARFDDKPSLTIPVGNYRFYQIPRISREGVAYPDVTNDYPFEYMGVNAQGNRFYLSDKDVEYPTDLDTLRLYRGHNNTHLFKIENVNPHSLTIRYVGYNLGHN